MMSHRTIKVEWLLCIVALTGTIQDTTANSQQGVTPTNVLGGLQQHASFSFVRPGLTQTAFAFNGPSSHQTFTSSIGDPHLLHRVQPSLTQALAYRNPGLGFVAYGNGPTPVSAYHPQQNDYAQQNYQLYQQPQQQQFYPSFEQPIDNQQRQAYLASRFTVPQQSTGIVPEQQLQQQQHNEQNLLGVAYSSAPSVAHVKVNGNGYKIDF